MSKHTFSSNTILANYLFKFALLSLTCIFVSVYVRIMLINVISCIEVELKQTSTVPGT